eukprot:2661613-Pyramimonas_sp.AAC.1
MLDGAILRLHQSSLGALTEHLDAVGSKHNASFSTDLFDRLGGGKGSYLSKTPVELRAMLDQEAKATLSTLRDAESAGTARQDDLWHCPMCPFRTFQRRE